MLSSFSDVVNSSPAWLDHFPSGKRSGAANAFYRAVRFNAAHTPEHVVQAVRYECLEYLDRPWVSPTRKTNETDLLSALGFDRPGALAFAAHILQVEALSPEEKTKRKAQQAAPHVRAHMARDFPTERQLAYLRRLGYAGPRPEDKAAASSLINALVQQHKGETH